MKLFLRLFSLALLGCYLTGCDLETVENPPSDKANTQNIDKFAAGVLNAIQAKSFATNREYCGVIGYDRNGQLIASPARTGGRDGCVPTRAPQVQRVIASYHTHGAATSLADTEAPSYHDILADVDEKIDGYISTPGGRFWKITHKDAVARMLCGRNCLHADKRHVECKRFPTAKRYTAKQLFDREMNNTLRC